MSPNTASPLEASPGRVVLDSKYLLIRPYPKEEDGATPEQVRQGDLANIAAGRIVRICKQGDAWRPVSFSEIRESIQADEQRYYDADAAWARGKRRQKAALRRRRMLAVPTLGLWLLTKRPKEPRYPDDTPHITYHPRSTQRGLRVLVGQGYLAEEEIGGELWYTPTSTFLERVSLMPHFRRDEDD